MADDRQQEQRSATKEYDKRSAAKNIQISQQKKENGK